MSGYVDHGWRHAPKAGGGTDPIPFPAGTQQLFPTHAPRLPVVSGAAGHRRWPGGVVVVSAYPYATNGTPTTNANQNSLFKHSSNVFRIATHTQVLDSSADGVSTFEFVAGDVGLIPGVEYSPCISWRYPAGGGSFGARGYVSKTSPSAGWASLGSAGTNEPEDFFGLYCSSQTVKYAALTDTVTVKVGSTTAGGSAAVEVDYVIFFPSGVMPLTGGPTPAPPSGMYAGYFRNIVGEVGPTTTYVGGSVHSPFSGDVYKDTQVMRGVLDPDFDFSLASFGLASSYYWVEYDSYYPGNVTYPRHIYAPVRLHDINGGADPDDFLWDEECFVTLMENGVPVDSAPIISSSWHFVYLGCHVIDGPNSLAFCLWSPPLQGTNARAPFATSSNWHEPYIDASVAAITSYLDHMEWNE